VRLKAVADPVRLQLISLIRASENGEACVCDLTEPVGLTQPTISYHLKILTQAGILEREQRGTWAWFRLVPERLDQIAAILR
jgi:ArsR family transcriptional regulator